MVRRLSNESISTYNMMSSDQRVQYLDAGYNVALSVIISGLVERLAVTKMDGKELYMGLCEECHVDMTVDSVTEFVL